MHKRSKIRMKRNKSFIGLTALITAILLILSGCQKNGPLPVVEMIEASDNSFGARYTFDLATFTAITDSTLDSERISLKTDEWETISDKLVDDNGVKYSSFCQHTGGVTFTVAVENESGKVMNIGCGCESKQLEDDDFRDRFIRISAYTALAAGGYDEGELSFFIKVYNDLFDSDDEIVCHGGSLYIKSIDDAATVLMTAPCSEEIIEKNRYQIINQ